jgi:hypothetical protein
MSVDDQTPNRDEIPNDILYLGRRLLSRSLGRCARRTAKCYEREGLPYTLIRGRKFTPAGHGWLREGERPRNGAGGRDEQTPPA